MKSFVKDFALDERKRAKKIAAMNLQQSRRPPVVLAEQNKRLASVSEKVSSVSEIINTDFKRSLTIGPDLKTFKSMLDIDNSSVTTLGPSTLVSAPTRMKRTEGKLSKYISKHHFV